MSLCAEAAGATVGIAPHGVGNGCAIRFAAAGRYDLRYTVRTWRLPGDGALPRVSPAA